MKGLYILNGKIPVECNDLETWAIQMEGKNRVIEQTLFGAIEVSTVFLGMDHSFFENKQLLFETMIFGGEHDLYQDRYETWDEAIEGHKKAISMVQQKNNI